MERDVGSAGTARVRGSSRIPVDRSRRLNDGPSSGGRSVGEHESAGIESGGRGRER